MTSLAAPVGAAVTQTTARFYAKRVAARSARRPTKFNIPVRVGVPAAARKEEQFSTRFDVLGPLIKDHYPVVPDQSRRNLMAAFDKRCNYFSDARVDREIIRGSLSLLDRIAPGALAPVEWTSDLFHAWNAQFPEAKRARHLAIFPTVAEVTTKTFSAKQIFVKVEALLKRHDPNWAPRIIYQSSDIHNVILGPVMQACTKRMFSALYRVNEPDSVSYRGAYSANSDSLCSFVNRAGSSESVFIESDFSSNDMTQLRDVHLLEIVWLRRLGAPAWVTGLMLHANSFKVSSRKHAISTRVTNQLPTGAQSTTFRNSMWNMSINFSFALRVRARGDCLILGDDMLMRYDNRISSRNGQICRLYKYICTLAGMVAEVKVRKNLCECEFLSKQFITTSFGHVLVPKFGKSIARFNARASSNEAVSDASYLAGKALSYSFEFRYAPPISRAFLLRYEQLVPKGGPSLDGLGWNAKGAFLAMGVTGVLAALRSVTRVACRDDLNCFYHWKYNLTYSDMMDTLLATLFGEEDLDEVGIARVLDDFV